MNNQQRPGNSLGEFFVNHSEIRHMYMYVDKIKHFKL